MIAEFQFETGVLGPALDAASAEAADISSLDSTGEVPLCAALWLGGAGTDVRNSLAEREVTRATTEVAAGQRGSLYRVRYGRGFSGTDVYRAAVEHGGMFVSGRAGAGAWTLRLQFPDRTAAAAFLDQCEVAGVSGSVEALYECEGSPRAARFRLTEPQRRTLAVAAQRGYFDVPRRTSLADLADELDVSSQAASERVRRGLDSLVKETLLAPADNTFTR
jgi:predicted DNA binding protein